MLAYYTRRENMHFAVVHRVYYRNFDVVLELIPTINNFFTLNHDWILPVIFSSLRDCLRMHFTFAAIFSKALYIKYAIPVTAVLNNKGPPKTPNMIVRIVVMPRAMVHRIPARMRNAGTIVMIATGIQIGANVAANTIKTNLRSWSFCLSSIVSMDDQH